MAPYLQKLIIYVIGKLILSMKKEDIAQFLNSQLLKLETKIKNSETTMDDQLLLPLVYLTKELLDLDDE